jgi:hypothetical protein
MTDHHNAIQTKGRAIQQMGDPCYISKEELKEACKAIRNYKLRDSASYFRKKNKKTYPTK